MHLLTRPTSNVELIYIFWNECAKRQESAVVDVLLWKEPPEETLIYHRWNFSVCSAFCKIHAFELRHSISTITISSSLLCVSMRWVGDKETWKSILNGMKDKALVTTYRNVWLLLIIISFYLERYSQVQRSNEHSYSFLNFSYPF